MMRPALEPPRVPSGISFLSLMSRPSQVGFLHIFLVPFQSPTTLLTLFRQQHPHANCTPARKTQRPRLLDHLLFQGRRRLNLRLLERGLHETKLRGLDCSPILNSTAQTPLPDEVRNRHTRRPGKTTQLLLLKIRYPYINPCHHLLLYTQDKTTTLYTQSQPPTYCGVGADLWDLVGLEVKGYSPPPPHPALPGGPAQSWLPKPRKSRGLLPRSRVITRWIVRS